MSESKGLTPKADFLKADVSAANFARSDSPQDEYRLNYNRTSSGGPAFELYFSIKARESQKNGLPQSPVSIRRVQLSNVAVDPYVFDVIVESDSRNEQIRIHRPLQGNSVADQEVVQKACDFLNFHQVNLSVIER